MRRVLTKRFLFAVLALFLLACGPRIGPLTADAVEADAVAAVVNASVDPLLSAYEAEGLAAIWEADTVEELMTAIPTVQTRWRPLWDALRAFAVVHDAWATALEEGREADTEAVRAAWCKLRALAAEHGVALEDFPVLMCEVGK